MESPRVKVRRCRPGVDQVSTRCRPGVDQVSARWSGVSQVSVRWLSGVNQVSTSCARKHIHNADGHRLHALAMVYL
eukprot:2383358-Pyramimonas_sp.AAC.2